jgi:hypothetical protein
MTSRRKELKIYSKNLKKSKRVYYFAPKPTVKWIGGKKIRHVRRHIELTAVLTEMLEQKNK